MYLLMYSLGIRKATVLYVKSTNSRASFARSVLWHSCSRSY